jgi:signal transduction histidine kinase
MNVVTQLSATHECDRDLRLQAVFEGAAIGIGICQFDGRILEANLALSRMLGCSQQELTETYVGEFCPELFSELFPGPFSELCSEPRGENGRDQRSSAISLDQRLLGELMRGERGSFEIEKHYRRKDGTALWAHLTVWLGHDERRQPAYLIVTLADATGRKQVEEHLREAEKMEVIGRLAGGIAHDFNNLLTGILLYCDLLSAGLDRGEADGHDADRWKTKTEAEACELCRHIEEVRRAGEQGAAMTQQLLAIAASKWRSHARSRSMKWWLRRKTYCGD